MKLNRRSWIKTTSQGLTALSFLSPFNPIDILSEWEKYLVEAGNAAEEKVRFQWVEKALASQDLPESLRAPLQQLRDLIYQWAYSKEIFNETAPEKRPRRYMSQFFRSVSLEERITPELPSASPLYPLAGLYRARILVAQVIQHGHLQAHPELRDAYFREAHQLMEAARKAFPENPLPSIYLGGRIPWQLDEAIPVQAPAWAFMQRETTHKLRHILHWWVEHRQVADGQFGGGWGDDVEMWRKWLPLLVAFDDPVLNQSQRKLAEGLFATDRMRGGYTNILFDVEHTAEDSADTCTAMMHIAREAPEWQDRALKLVTLMKERWTGKNERGFLQFKSTYFSADQVDPDPRKACDTVYHPRTIQPALLLWQRTGNPAIGEVVTAWMDTWVDATQRAEQGKPAGIVPSAIHWPDGRVGGITDTWWDPGNHTDDPLYVWPSAMPIMLNTLLLTYHMSGDNKYLAPIFSMATHYAQHRKDEPGAPGTLSWCVSQMHEFLPEVLAKYRLISGDTQFDELIRTSQDGYIRYYLSGDEQSVMQGLQEQNAAFAANQVVFTDEVLWTDRVFSFNSNYFNRIAPAPIPSFDPSFLFSMLTGNIGNPLYFPINAVRWLSSGEDLAVWVKKATPEELRVDLYHFGESPRSLKAEWLILAPGTYQASLQQGAQTLDQQKVSVERDPPVVEITLPPRQTCTWQISRA